jgi:predicted nuclease with TOPRIM domain
MESDAKEILEAVNFIKDRMTTKEELADLKGEMLDQFEHVEAQFAATQERLRDIISEVTVIHRRIERLEEQGASNAGFAREIDHALERIAAIEKHLGLDKKIAA